MPYLHQCDSVVSTKSQHFTPTISCKHSQAWAWKKVGQTSKKAGGGPRRIVIQMNNSYCLISSWCLLFLITMFTTQRLSKSRDNLIAAYSGQLWQEWPIMCIWFWYGILQSLNAIINRHINTPMLEAAIRLNKNYLLLEFSDLSLTSRGDKYFQVAAKSRNNFYTLLS